MSRARIITFILTYLSSIYFFNLFEQYKLLLFQIRILNIM